MNAFALCFTALTRFVVPWQVCWPDWHICASLPFISGLSKVAISLGTTKDWAILILWPSVVPYLVWCSDQSENLFGPCNLQSMSRFCCWRGPFSGRHQRATYVHLPARRHYCPCPFCLVSDTKTNCQPSKWHWHNRLSLSPWLHLTRHDFLTRKCKKWHNNKQKYLSIILNAAQA